MNYYFWVIFISFLFLKSENHFHFCYKNSFFKRVHVYLEELLIKKEVYLEEEHNG